MSTTSASAKFEPVFARLRKIMATQGSGLTVLHDAPHDFTVVGTSKYRGGPLHFGAVMLKKNYVSYHLLAIYMFPELAEGASAALLKRKQGKACFNFATVDEALFAELAALTARCADRFRALPKVIEPDFFKNRSRD